MDSFAQRKKSILEKKDKAAKGSWDSRVVDICNKLNECDNYYTTSSCSGKSVLMEEKVGKDGSYYLWSSHDLIDFEELFNKLLDLKKSKVSEGVVIKFKSESPILFVCCSDIESAKEFLEKSVNSGFKESGIKITDKLIAVEIRSGEKVELPIFSGGNVLVDENFIRVLVREVNFKLERAWKKLSILENLI